MARASRNSPKTKYITLVFLFFAIVLSQKASANTLNVCQTGCAFNKLKSAVLASKPNDEIHIALGTYVEYDILVPHTLHIVGEKDANGSTPIIDGTHSNQTIIRVLNVENFTIENLTLQNTGFSYIEEIAAIKMIESKNCTIKSNHIFDTTYGVYLEKTYGCKIIENKFFGLAKEETKAGNAIHIWTGSDHLIENNTIEGHRDGIYLEFSSNCTIKKNTVTHNVRYGLHFMSSHETSYFDNVFSFNGAGVAVMYSHKIKMHRNEFSQNIGPSAYGLLLKDIQASEIFENRFFNNTIGIYMEGSNRSQFTNNLFMSNGWGLKIMGDCENNVFTKNDFISNSFEVTTNSDHSWNSFNQNYWSQYSGYDLDRNETGDIVHRPVSLSSVILERVDSAYILMRSPLFNLLDQIERSFPTLIPEPLKDEAPLMTQTETFKK